MHTSSNLPWQVEHIDFSSVDSTVIRHDEDLFFLLCSASFVESGSDRYSHNLVDHYLGNAELQGWLAQHWQHEELQHGRALATYVQTVWPEFDWQQGFSAFWQEYSVLCTAEELESSPGLELAARCVVETGTATFYRALHDMTDEPLLSQLTELIKRDEVRHYKNFLQHFLQYSVQEQLSRYQVLRAILRRAYEIQNEDSDIALRHVFHTRYPHESDRRKFKEISRRARRRLRSNVYPVMTLKMLLKPLSLPVPIQHTLEKPILYVAQKILAS